MVEISLDVVVNDEPKEVLYCYLIDDELINESDFARRLEEECYSYAEDIYDDMLDDCYGQINVCGYEYYASKLLEDTDPIAYRCGLSDYSDSLLSDYLYDLDNGEKVIINDIIFEKIEL